MKQVSAVVTPMMIMMIYAWANSKTAPLIIFPSGTAMSSAAFKNPKKLNSVKTIVGSSKQQVKKFVYLFTLL